MHANHAYGLTPFRAESINFSRRVIGICLDFCSGDGQFLLAAALCHYYENTVILRPILQGRATEKAIPVVLLATCAERLIITYSCYALGT
jgi:hypothetical protein